MRTPLTIAALSPFFVLFAACARKQDDTPPPTVATAPSAYQSYPPPSYAPPQPGYAPAGSMQMAVPGPIAFQCQNDVPCGTHHCNMQYGKCAFPCQSAADCISPNQCLAGLCIPAPPH
jgi:hypothetical protein